MTNIKSPEFGQYEPLANLIEPFIELSFDDLPEPVQSHWNNDSIIAWDSLAPNQRRSVAQQHDQQHDPANKPENKYWFDLSVEIDNEERQQRAWELSDPQGVPSEIATRNGNLNVSKRRLQSLDRLWSRPPFTIKDWHDVCNAKLEEILAEALQADPTAPAGTVEAAPVVEAPASETPEQRRARWLDWWGKGERGAVRRVYERELLQNPKADRSYIGKQITKARTEQADKKRGGAWVSQLVQDGKR